MGFDLRDKPLLITGASSGIGAATAVRAARAGMPVVVTARRLDRLERVAEEVRSAGGRAEAMSLDVTDAGACAAAVARCDEAFGPPYAVLANAGYGFDAPAHETTDEAMRAIFETNFYGTLNIVRASLPGMLEARAGHVLITSSCVSKLALPRFSAYTATKAAQNHIGRAMNLELRGTGVRASTIHPVGTKTEFFDTAKTNSEPGNHSLGDHAPSWAMQSADTVARAIVRCLRRPRSEVWPAWSPLVRIGMSICTAFPVLADWGTKRLAK